MVMARPTVGQAGTAAEVDNTPITKRRDRSRMRRSSTRDRAAAALFAIAATPLLVAAVATRSLVLAGISVALLLAAVAALRGYPIDRVW
jgi:hypothetical protein